MNKIKLTTNARFTFLRNGEGDYHYGYWFTDSMRREWTFGVKSTKRGWCLDGFRDGKRFMQEHFGRLYEVRGRILEVRTVVIDVNAPVTRVRQGLAIFRDVPKHGPSGLGYYTFLQDNPQLRKSIGQGIQEACRDYIERTMPDLSPEERTWFMNEVESLGLDNLYVHLDFSATKEATA